jgi:hypothetical protein
MKQSWLLLLTCLVFADHGGPCFAAETPKSNVLVIILDDQNAFAGRTDLAPEPVTPNLDRFAKRGVIFANAQCPAPICNPSRTAFLSGLRPSTTGIYDNEQHSLPAGHILRRTTSLPGYFRERGYYTASSGKVFGAAFRAVIKNGVWDETMYAGGGKSHKTDPVPPKEKMPVGLGMGDPAVPQCRIWGHIVVRKGSRIFTKPRVQPFLACGIVKPHTLVCAGGI